MSNNKAMPTETSRGPAGGGMRGPMGGGPMGGGMMPGQKAKDFKGTLRKLIAYLKPFLPMMILVIILAITSTILTLQAPKIMARATDEIVGGFVGKMGLSAISDVQESTNFAPMIVKMGITPIADCTTNEQKADSFQQTATLLMQQLENIPEDQKPDILTKYDLTEESITEISDRIRTLGGGVDFTIIRDILLLLGVLYLLSAAFSYGQQYIMAGVTQKIVFNMRRDINAKLTRLPLKYYDSRTHGEILSRVTNDVDTISSSLQQSLTQIITSAVMIVGIIVMLVTISPYMALISLATLPIVMTMTIFIAKKSQKYFKGTQASLGDLNGHVEEMYTGHSVVKAYNYEAKSIEVFEKTNEELCGYVWKSQFLSGSMMPAINFVSNLGYVAVCVVGGVIASGGGISIGDIQACIQYSRQLNMPIAQASQIANILQSTIAAAERVFEVLEEPEQQPDPVAPEQVVNPQGNVQLEQIRFGYTGEQTLIHGLDIDVKPGQTIAIVGPTGAGKTTLVNLLMRFYEVDGGRITIDGVDSRNMTREGLRDLFGMVLQDTWLFTGTIYDNIAFGRQDSTREEVIAAAKAAHADHFIRTLPQGYDTILNEDATNISQGQRQLLTIARAVLKDPAILILDEATSSVDTRTEVLIQEAMSRLQHGRTSFVIAHRLSTIRNADSILVMNHGDIVEKGSHEQLMAADGFYAELYNSQFTTGVIESA